MYPFSDVIDTILKGKRTGRISGLWGSSKALFLATLSEKTGRPIFVITPDNETAESLLTDLHFFSSWVTSRPPVFSFPFWEILPYDTIPPHQDITHRRMSTYHALISGARGVYAASVHSVMQRVIPPNLLKDAIIKICTGMEIERDSLTAHLVNIGYEPSDIVINRGTFSLRGGIVDLFSPGEEAPVRLEYFGDTIDSIRSFDPETQRSVSHTGSSIIMPAKEPPFLQLLSGDGVQQPLGSLLEYLSKEGVIVFDEIRGVNRSAAEYWNQIWETYEQMLSERRIVSRPESLYLSWDDLVKIRKGFTCTLDLESLPIEGASGIESIDSESTGLSLNSAAGIFSVAARSDSPLKDAAERLDDIRRSNTLIIVSPTEGQAERLRDVLQEYNVPAAVSKPEEIMHSLTITPVQRRLSLPVFIVKGLLAAGFIYPAVSLAILTEEEIFGKRTKRRPLPKQKARSFLTSFRDLRHGDYVVHLQHGIGQYNGLIRKILSGGEGDFLCIRYAGGDSVYVPVNKMELVQKYMGAEGHPPHIDRLQGSQWEKTKRRVQKAVEGIAADLVDLYAARMIVERPAYPLDSYLIREFETSFEYEETPDQLAAIEDVKSDLESRRPMDRLICGDVGYGKTEIALRAACKVVMDSKQAAILVPTTLLAQQHYQTFTQRFTSFPVRVEMLSRFRTQQEQKEIIKALSEGSVDIVIGTHRLLQKDISFRDLGLVIVDEEQRFGVRQKERLKQLRKSVDVLALTATPIPRTLQMALLGIRDLSIIETPPEDRLSIRTMIVHFDKRIIRNAVLREFARGGNVFFVHNRVESIGRLASFLQELLPEARIGVAHGQMREHLLEDVMLKFIQGDYNLLVCSAIIESGLDIPSANTIIINRADLFGLAELYQLRGRVGRSGHQAYAYLIIPAEDSLAGDAQKRIKAIQELTDLGAGFRLATKDLEIRGAGNMLGGQQSGHIASVGFELYTQMLDRSVKRMQGKTFEEDFSPTINLRISAFIPEDYIEDSSQRLSFYKRLAAVREVSSLVSLREELVDRYGPLPFQVENLFRIIEIKLLACTSRVSRIEGGDDGILFTVDQQTDVKKNIFQSLISSYPSYMGRFSFISEYKFLLLLKSQDSQSIFTEIIKCLKVIGGCA
ncbi:MAG: transcription-repair coupling factor [Nitrospirae bacterium]|nr:transcription-repair coupling factor [Nitrospirota bacterium]